MISCPDFAVSEFALPGITSASSFSSLNGMVSLDVHSMLTHPALVVGLAKWVPAWITPLWVLSIGLLIGVIAAVALYGVLSLLSLVTPLGHLADKPSRGITASLIVGGLIGAGLCATYVPTAGEYANTLFLPLICIGLVLGFGVIYGMWHRTRSEWGSMINEGVIPYLLCTLGLFALVGLAGTPFVEDPRSILNSIAAVNLVGDGTEQITVEVKASPELPAGEAPFLPANIDYQLRNVTGLTIESDRTVLLGDSADSASFGRPPQRVNEGEKLVYNYENRDLPPIPSDPTRLHIQNREIDDAKVVFTFKNQPLVPQASSILVIAFTLFLTLTGLVAFRQAAPRVWALALSTAKNEMAQPLYLLLLAIGLFGVLLFGIYPFNTLGDDIRLLKDSGVTLIMVLGMVQAVWSAGTSVSEEIEGRTALTVLSKPVSRRSFILGKYAGIMLSVLVLFVILSAVLTVVISYKPIYDARETASGDPIWQTGHDEIMTTLPVLGLYLMETMAIGAIAVALATRLPLLANFISCFMIYVIGNLTSPLVASARDNNELVGFVGKLIAVVIPNLNIFNVQAAVDTGNQIPLIYLAGAFNYLVCFSIAIWMLAMLLFEDRDLA